MPCRLSGEYRHPEDEDIINAIDSLSKLGGMELDWDKLDQDDMPTTLKKSIDKNDSRLNRDLQNAMQTRI